MQQGNLSNTVIECFFFLSLSLLICKNNNFLSHIRLNCGKTLTDFTSILNLHRLSRLPICFCESEF